MHGGVWEKGRIFRLVFSGVPPRSRFPHPSSAVPLGFLDLAANFLPGGFSCWAVLVCWELKRLVETCQLC